MGCCSSKATSAAEEQKDSAKRGGRGSKYGAEAGGERKEEAANKKQKKGPSLKGQTEDGSSTEVRALSWTPSEDLATHNGPRVLALEATFGHVGTATPFAAYQNGPELDGSTHATASSKERGSKSSARAFQFENQNSPEAAEVSPKRERKKWFESNEPQPPRERKKWFDGKEAPPPASALSYLRASSSQEQNAAGSTGTSHAHAAILPVIPTKSPVRSKSGVPLGATPDLPRTKSPSGFDAPLKERSRSGRVGNHTKSEPRPGHSDHAKSNPTLAAAGWKTPDISPNRARGVAPSGNNRRPSPDSPGRPVWVSGGSSGGGAFPRLPGQLSGAKSPKPAKPEPSVPSTARAAPISSQSVHSSTSSTAQVRHFAQPRRRSPWGSPPSNVSHSGQQQPESSHSSATSARTSASAQVRPKSPLGSPSIPLTAQSEGTPTRNANTRYRVQNQPESSHNSATSSRTSASTQLNTKPPLTSPPVTPNTPQYASHGQNTTHIQQPVSPQLPRPRSPWGPPADPVPSSSQAPPLSSRSRPSSPSRSSNSNSQPRPRSSWGFGPIADAPSQELVQSSQRVSTSDGAATSTLPPKFPKESVNGVRTSETGSVNSRKRSVTPSKGTDAPTPAQKATKASEATVLKSTSSETSASSEARKTPSRPPSGSGRSKANPASQPNRPVEDEKARRSRLVNQAIAKVKSRAAMDDDSQSIKSSASSYSKPTNTGQGSNYGQEAAMKLQRQVTPQRTSSLSNPTPESPASSSDNDRSSSAPRAIGWGAGRADDVIQYASKNRSPTPVKTPSYISSEPQSKAAKPQPQRNNQADAMHVDSPEHVHTPSVASPMVTEDQKSSLEGEQSMPVAKKYFDQDRVLVIQARAVALQQRPTSKTRPQSAAQKNPTTKQIQPESKVPAPVHQMVRLGPEVTQTNKNGTFVSSGVAMTVDESLEGETRDAAAQQVQSIIQAMMQHHAVQGKKPPATNKAAGPPTASAGNGAVQKASPPSQIPSKQPNSLAWQTLTSSNPGIKQMRAMLKEVHGALAARVDHLSQNGAMKAAAAQGGPPPGSFLLHPDSPAWQTFKANNVDVGQMQDMLQDLHGALEARLQELSANGGAEITKQAQGQQQRPEALANGSYKPDQDQKRSEVRATDQARVGAANNKAVDDTLKAVLAARKRSRMGKNQEQGKAEAINNPAPPLTTSAASNESRSPAPDPPHSRPTSAVSQSSKSSGRAPSTNGVASSMAGSTSGAPIVKSREDIAAHLDMIERSIRRRMQDASSS